MPPRALSRRSFILSVPRFYVVAKQQILVAQVQLTVGNDRVRPGGLLAAVGLVETTAFEVLLRVRLDEEHRALLGTIVEAAIRQGHRAFWRPMFRVVAL